MDELKRCCDAAIDNGAMDEASLRLTVTYMLLSQAFMKYDEAIDILEEQNIGMGKDKYIVKRVLKAFDEYFDVTKKLMNNANTRRFAGEFDRINEQIEAIVHKEMSCWDDDAVEGEDYKVCEVCGKRKNIDEFSKSYSHRCKECVAKMQREKRKRKKGKEEKIQCIIAGLDRKKMQACQIYARTLVVPYERALKVIKELKNEYEGNDKRRA